MHEGWGLGGVRVDLFRTRFLTKGSRGTRGRWSGTQFLFGDPKLMMGIYWFRIKPIYVRMEVRVRKKEKVYIQ